MTVKDSQETNSNFECEDELDDYPLSKEDGDSLRKLIRHLSDDHDINYTMLASKLKLDPKKYIFPITGDRGNGTRFVKRKITDLCDRLKIDWKPFFARQQKHNKDQSDNSELLKTFRITDEDLERALKLRHSCFLMLTLVRDDGVNATWYRFRGPSSKGTLPRYVGWRVNGDDSVSSTSGVYYLSRDTLKLIGGDAQGTDRSLALIPYHNGRDSRDWYGFTIGESDEYRLFSVPCYLKRLDCRNMRKSYKDWTRGYGHDRKWIGEHTQGEAGILFPEIVRHLNNVRKLPHLAPRSSGP